MSRDIMMQSSICLNFTLRNVIIAVVDFVRLKFLPLDGDSLHNFRSGLLYIMYSKSEFGRYSWTHV